MAKAVQTPGYDVAIVGLGPVGAIFANLLSNYGLKIAVVERAAGDLRQAARDHAATTRRCAYCRLAVSARGHEMRRAASGSHYLGVDGEVIESSIRCRRRYPLGWIPNVTFVQPDAGGRRCATSSRGYANAERPAVRPRACRWRRMTDAVRLAGADGCRWRRGDRGALSWSAATALTALCASALGAATGGSRLRRMVDGGRYADQRAGQLPAKSLQYCWPSRPATFIRVPAICAAGRSSCCRARIRRPSARTKMSLADRAKVLPILRADDVALGGLSLPCAGGDALARRAACC